MNKQTRSLREKHTSTKVGKGVNLYTNNVKGGTDAVLTGALTFHTFESTEGTNVNSSKNRAERGKKPWRGCGDPLGRNK